MDRLLILACSQRKVRTKDLLRALDRYDGPAFRVLRKHLRENANEPLTVFVLSAKFGLIEADREIPWYDCRLRQGSAERIQAQVREQAFGIFAAHRWQSIGLCAGKDYRSLLEEALDSAAVHVRADMLGGGLGRRLSALRDWLRRESACLPSASPEYGA
jgi:hypothetical protein